jgi:hypothetical protein
MLETISETEYDDELQAQGEYLRDIAEEAVENGEYDEFRGACYELVSDALDHHNWFARSYYGPAAHGAIIEHAADAGYDITRHRDISWVGDSEDPEKIIKQLAYMAFETHVIEDAIELHNV